MSCKSIVLVASGDKEDGAVMTATASLAARFSAHIEVVPVFPDPAADLVYYGSSMAAPSPSAEARIAESEREIHAQLAALARDVAQREGFGFGDGPGPSIDIDRRSLGPAAALATAASLADIVVFSAVATRDPFMLGGFFAETLLSTRAPVLLAKGDQIELDAVAVAWDGSLQAARAARAALPLLRAAGGVLILTNTDDQGYDRNAANPDRLHRMLTRHGVSNIATRPLRGAHVADSLLEAAKSDKCDIIVAGGYGRPRIVELALGGTTRALAHAEGRPHIFFAH